LQEEQKWIVIVTDVPQPVTGVGVRRQQIHPVKEWKGRNFGGNFFLSSVTAVCKCPNRDVHLSSAPLIKLPRYGLKLH